MKITVYVKPYSNHPGVEQVENNRYIIHVQAGPQNNQANQEMIKRLAQFLNVPPSALTICHGAKSRTKVVKLSLPPR